jgi:malonyl-CoA/methylmalonyl-CoA synthetase
MATVLDAILAQPPSAPALRTPQGEVTTYGDLADASAALAAALVERHGVAPGDRVAMLVEPGPRFDATLLAVWRARGVALVLTHLHPPKERASLVEDARPVLLVTSEVHDAAARSSAGAVPVWTLGADAITSLDASRVARGRALVPDAGDRALQMYTSGTTGKPKGVLLRHTHLEAQLSALARAWGMSATDALVHALPLHHIHGLAIAMLNALRVGGLVELHGAFDAKAVLAACARATVFMGVPTMVARLVDELDAMPEAERAEASAHLRAMRLCVSGSAALPVSLGNRWADYAGRYPLERFGMTELGVALTNPLHGERVPGSVGRPLEGVRVRVVDEAGREAREGELLVGGPTIFEGYFERPEANAESFVEVGGERFFKTGDTVALDDRDRVRILGRTSVDILKSAGYKLSAIEIEEALRRHPGVRDAAVVGLPDETYGQRVAAAVMPKEGSSVTPEGLSAFLAEELAPYKLPRVWRIVDDVPRNALGKVVKPELARLFAEGRR